MTRSSIHLEMDNQLIEPSRFERLLGVLISRNCKFNHHIKDSDHSLIKQLQRRLTALRIICKDASFQQRKLLVQGLFISKLSFCISSWGGFMGKYLHELEVLQNAAARIVTRSPMTTRLSKLYKELGWLRLTSMLKYFDQLQLQSIRQKRHPKDMYEIIGESFTHDHFTRSRNRGLIQLTNRNTARNTLLYNSFIPRAVRDYNSLPDHIKIAESRQIFKKSLKKHLLDSQF